MLKYPCVPIAPLAGAAPIHRAIAAGDRETGICIMQMEPTLDTGPVILRKTLPIGPTDTTGQLHDKLANLGAVAIQQALDCLSNDALPHLTPEPQGDQGVTYAAKIDKGETQINWAEDPALIARKIRAFSPFPGAWCQVGGQRIKVLNARVGSGGLAHKGVEFLSLQRAGKKPQTPEDFLRGFPDFLDRLRDV